MPWDRTSAGRGAAAKAFGARAGNNSGKIERKTRMCDCINLGCACNQHNSARYLAMQQAQGVLGTPLGAMLDILTQQQAQDFPRFKLDVENERYNPKYPPTTEETYGEFGTAAQTDYENIIAHKERNTKDVSKMRVFAQDKQNKTRREAYDKWIERRDEWDE